jgi:hypothetical protein
VSPVPAHVPGAPTDDHGGLALYRLWHPNSLTPTAIHLRTWGPSWRFDPHPLPCTDRADGPAAWYGGESFETAVREKYDRFVPGEIRLVSICRRTRVSVVRLPSPTRLLDLPAQAATIGAPGDLGDDPTADYTDTWEWARALHANHDYDGLRYWSARHRHPDGSRAGVNVVLWRLPAGPLEVVADEPFSNPGVEARVVTMLSQPHIDIATVLVDSCAGCLR